MLAALALALTCCAHERVSIEFANAVRTADRIVQGEVVRVVTLPYVGPAPERFRWFDEETVIGRDFQVAEISVERALKGDAPVDTLIVRADAIVEWDAANVRVGQRGVFFLLDSSRFAWLPQQTAGEWAREFGERPLRALVGDDAVFLESEVDRTQLESARFVTLPTELAVRRIAYRTLVSPADLERAIAGLVEKQRKPLLTLELIDSQNGERPWKLELARDGRASVGDERFKVYGLFALERAFQNHDFTTSRVSVRLHGSVQATFELTLHSKNGPLVYRVEVSPYLAATNAEVEELWRAVARDLEDSAAPSIVRSSLGLRSPR